MRKWLQRVLLGAVLLTLSGWLMGAWLLRRWTAKPPPLPRDVTIRQLQPESRESQLLLGERLSAVVVEAIRSGLEPDRLREMFDRAIKQALRTEGVTE